MLTDHATPPAHPAAPPIAAAVSKPQRRYCGHKPINSAPRVMIMLMDGRLAARVALGGKDGEGRYMLVDWDVWANTIVPTYGAGWGVNLSHQGKPYVVRCVQVFAAEARQGSRQRGSRAILRLHRVIAKPPADHQVWFRNGDTLDMRLVNLEVVNVAEARRRRFALYPGSVKWRVSHT